MLRRVGMYLYASYCRLLVVLIGLLLWVFVAVLPRKGAVTIIIGKPVQAMGSIWNAAVTLRDEVHAEILHHCGEPDLAGVYSSLSQIEIERPDISKREEL